MTGVLPEILIQCRRNIFILLKKTKKKTRFRQVIQTMQCVFGVKNLVLKKYNKISTGVNPGILIQCRPNVFALFKKPKILTSKVGHGFFGVTSMVLMKYPKILTGVLLLDILIKCRPKIVVLFKNPKILTRKIGHGFFWRQKIWFLWNPKILTGVLLEILIQCRPKISVLFKNPKTLTSKIGHGLFGVKKLVSYEITQVFDRC